MNLNVIDHCVYYDKSILCIQCEEGYGLSPERTACYLTEQNCYIATYDIECSICNGGY